MEDIFNLKDLNDIPAEMRKELLITKETDNRLLHLFNQRKSGILNLTEVLVGYYRTYKEEKTRNYMMVACYRLVKKGLLSSTKTKGQYKLTDLGKSCAPPQAQEE